MNRRDFLKMLGLGLVAVLARRLPKIKPKPAPMGTAATLEVSADGVDWTEFPETVMGCPIRWEENADGWSCVDIQPPPDYIRQRGVLVDSPHNPSMLMGYPVVLLDKIPGTPEVPLVFGDWTERAHSQDYWVTK